MMMNKFLNTLRAVKNSFLFLSLTILVLLTAVAINRSFSPVDLTDLETSFLNFDSYAIRGSDGHDKAEAVGLSIDVVFCGSVCANQRASRFKPGGIMKNLINPILSLTLLALCTTASTGCIIIIEPEEPPHGPILDVPEPDIKPCHTLAGECNDGFEMVSMGEDINGCPILSCEPISSATCEDDGDCERPDQVCLPDPECASSDDCLNICQTFTPPPPTPPPPRRPTRRS